MTTAEGERPGKGKIVGYWLWSSVLCFHSRDVNLSTSRWEKVQIVLKLVYKLSADEVVLAVSMLGSSSGEIFEIHFHARVQILSSECILIVFVGTAQSWFAISGVFGFF